MNYNLYTKDASGSIRFWRMEQQGSTYRTVTGVWPNGVAVESQWKQAEAKNIGKVNETSAEQQAEAEIKAQYKKKLDRKYHENVSDLENKATGYKFLAPMLAQKFNTEMEIPPGTMVQPKLDGIRMIASKDGFYSRQGKPFNIPHLWEVLEPVFTEKPWLILDGELYNHGLRDDFNSITSLVKREKRSSEQEQRLRNLIQYHVYDSPSMDLNFVDRELALYSILGDIGDPIILVETQLVKNHDEINKYYEKFLKDGYEGQIVRLNEPYENKRSKNLLKRKEFLDTEFPIIEISEGQGNWAGYAKSVTCSLPSGTKFNAGIKGDQEFTKQLLKDKDKYKFVTVKYFTPTPDGIPRFPVAIDWHTTEKDH